MQQDFAVARARVLLHRAPELIEGVIGETIEKILERETHPENRTLTAPRGHGPMVASRPMKLDMERLEEIVEDSVDRVRRSKMSNTAKRMVYLHMTKPWINNFAAIAISPNRDNLESFFSYPIGRYEGRIWYYPSLKWWKAHAKTSHPPSGGGCDVSTHVEFLTGEEFYYATIFQNGKVKILKASDFEKECEWWEKHS